MAGTRFDTAEEGDGVNVDLISSDLEVPRSSPLFERPEPTEPDAK
jgi:hypothetical protein